ncbi:MAG: glycosyltransferase [Terriglobia bacterium]|jgi:processive 1,2-diacylglycerol beta-glucosyltransferase
MEIRRIAILTLGVGAGPLRASQAVHLALHDGADNVEARTIDILDLAAPWFLRLYAYPYWLMVRRLPSVWRRLFDWRLRKQLRKTSPDWLFRRGCRSVLDRLRSYRPHLVIATEMGAARVAGLGRREGWFDAPILAVQTDFCAQPPWVRKEIDVHCVGSEEARSQLIAWGVSANRIVNCGVPIDPTFALRFDRAELRRALGLHPTRPVVLLMGGGISPAPLDTIVKSLEMCRHPIQVLAVTGKDRNMRRRLEALRGKLALDLHVLGWSDSIPELMAAADLLITRPGGVTTSEGLAAGLPLILAFPVPGMEERHLKFLVERKVAIAARAHEEIPALVSSLLDDPKQMEAWSARGKEMARPDAAYSVAQVARALLEKATYIDLLATPLPVSGESAYLM